MLETSNTRVLREILRRVSQHSSRTTIQKKPDKLILSSMDKDEKSIVSALLKESFFTRWESSSEETLEVESRNLYNLSKIIPASSATYMDVLEDRIEIIIKGDYTKNIVIAGEGPESLVPEIDTTGKPSLTIRSDIFRNIIRDLDSFTDETSIALEDRSSPVTFRSKERQMDVVFRLEERPTDRSSDSFSVEVPIRYLGYFSPILGEFSELQISTARGDPLLVRGANDEWEFALMVSSL